MDVICLKGRVHLFEGISFDKVKVIVRTLFLMGCDNIILTNAAGSTREDIGVGEVVAIHDHINFQTTNPLVGKNDDEFGPRFVPLNNAYDKSLLDKFLMIADKNNIKINTAVYLAVTGPCFETPSEVQVFKNMGADLLGMSTVPEVIIANHCGMRVSAFSVITNYAEGIGSEEISHEDNLKNAKMGGDKLKVIIKGYFKEYGSQN